MVTTTVHTLESAPEASKPLLENSVKGFGRIPNLHGVMATSPALLQAYQQVHGLVMGSTAFTPEERTVVWMTVNIANACHYCVPAHTAIAKMEKIDDDIVTALRDETALPEKLEALRTFTLAIRDTHGHPGADAVAAFEAAGYDQRAILDVILIISQKVMSNYTNAILATPTDEAFAQFAWEPKAVAAE